MVVNRTGRNGQLKLSLVVEKLDSFSRRSYRGYSNLVGGKQIAYVEGGSGIGDSCALKI